MGKVPKEHVLGLDIGTTTVRSIVYNKRGEVCGSCSVKVETLYPKPGWVEIDPDSLWEKIQQVMKSSMMEASVDGGDLASIGISCQRATFTCWSKRTGRHYHNLLTWKDMRADKLVSEWNNGISMRALRLGGKILYGVSRMPRYKAASMYTLLNKLVTLRLLWVLDHVPGMRDAVQKGDVMFGCVDSWVLYKLTGKHMTEVSNIAATGIFDPFTMQYADWIFSLFNIPASIMPPIVSSSGDQFGLTFPHILGTAVPIGAVMADQSASVYGTDCLQPGSAKITLGTGSFLDVVTKEAHASMTGLVPIVGWRIGEKVVHLAEGSVHDTGVLLEWAKQVELFNNYQEISEVVSSVPDSGGVYFVPGFHGLQRPINDPSATAGFIGLSLTTTKPQMLRAILESIAFSQKQLVDAFLSESHLKVEKLLIDGGVANNDYLVQLIADITGLTVERPASVEMSAWGVASLAGIQVGLWTPEELTALKRKGTTFTCRQTNTRIHEDYQAWLKACKRFMHWNNIEAF